MGKLEYRLLERLEIDEGLAKLKGWALKDGAIFKSFEFGEYQQGLVFATAVGYLADRLDHHPDLSIGYKRVEVSMLTHSVKGISPYDFELAGRIDGIS